MTTPEADTLDRNAPQVIIVDSDVDQVSCDGGNSALGHPMVWYSFDGRDQLSCGYCDRTFVKKAS